MSSREDGSASSGDKMVPSQQQAGEGGRGVDPRRSGLLATRTGVCESQRLVSETQVHLPIVQPCVPS